MHSFVCDVVCEIHEYRVVITCLKGEWNGGNAQILEFQQSFDWTGTLLKLRINGLIENLKSTLNWRIFGSTGVVTERGLVRQGL